MALKHSNITAIPTSPAPDAVPSLWNTRYDEIDENFADLDVRQGAVEEEVGDARGGEVSLAARLAAFEAGVAGISESDQNAFWSAGSFALADTGLLAKEIDAQRFSRHQQGEFILYNRGIKSGCGLSKSANANRNLNIASGFVFAHGREWAVTEQINGAAVPGNTGSAAQTCYAYLVDNGGVMDLSCTNLGESAPENALVLASVLVPAGNTDSTDPNIAACTVTPTVRTEANWPAVQMSPIFEDVTFARTFAGVGYGISFCVGSFEGGESPSLIADDIDRTANNCRVYLDGMADAVTVRYVAHLMGK